MEYDRKQAAGETDRSMSEWYRLALLKSKQLLGPTIKLIVSFDGKEWSCHVGNIGGSIGSGTGSSVEAARLAAMEAWLTAAARERSKARNNFQKTGK